MDRSLRGGVLLPICDQPAGRRTRPGPGIVKEVPLLEDSLLSTIGLSHPYQRGRLAFRDVTLEISRGRKIAFLGPNGAGKSTLFLHFNGILRPKAGEVRYDGAPLKYDQGSLAALRQDVAIVLQNPDDQIFSSTVEEDVA